MPFKLGQFRMIPHDQGYQFLDRNRWPVSWDQEDCLSVIDVLSQGCVHLVEKRFNVLPHSQLPSLESSERMVTSLKSIGSSFTSLQSSHVGDVCAVKRRRYRDRLGRRSNSNDMNGCSSLDSAQHSKRQATSDYCPPLPPDPPSTRPLSNPLLAPSHTRTQSTLQ